MIHIRPCNGFEELQACVDLQVATWGYDAGDVVPRKLFLVAQKVGGQVLAAFDLPQMAEDENSREQFPGGPESMVGFLLALPGVKSQEGVARPYLHSHMLAVLPTHRNQGIGAQLKQYQRIDALDRGIRLIEWTFDPLEIKNAYLNICKLGAIVRRYEVDFYGVSSSRLQGGLPTDRLVAEWRLDSPRVEAALSGRSVEKASVVEEIHLPAEIYAWKASEHSRDRALAVQQENRSRFRQAFSQGLCVAGYRRTDAGGGVFELSEYSSIRDLLSGD